MCQALLLLMILSRWQVKRHTHREAHTESDFICVVFGLLFLRLSMNSTFLIFATFSFILVVSLALERNTRQNKKRQSIECGEHMLQSIHTCQTWNTEKQIQQSNDFCCCCGCCCLLFGLILHSNRTTERKTNENWLNWLIADRRIVDYRKSISISFAYFMQKENKNWHLAVAIICIRFPC